MLFRSPTGMDALQRRGFTIVALTPRSPSLSVWTWAREVRPSPWALVVGSEGAGISEAVERRADVRVCIPMARGVDSLNVTVAAGIALSVLSGAAGDWSSPHEAAAARDPIRGRGRIEGQDLPGLTAAPDKD